MPRLLRCMFKSVFRMEMSSLLILIWVQVFDFLVSLLIVFEHVDLTWEVWFHVLVQLADSFVELVFEMHLDDAEKGGKNNEFNSTAEWISFVRNHYGGLIGILRNFSTDHSSKEYHNPLEQCEKVFTEKVLGDLVYCMLVIWRRNRWTWWSLRFLIWTKLQSMHFNQGLDWIYIYLLWLLNLTFRVCFPSAIEVFMPLLVTVVVSVVFLLLPSSNFIWVHV